MVLYGCQTWSLGTKGEHSLKVFQSRVLRRIFGLERDKVAGGDLYSLPNIIRVMKSRRMRLAGHVARMVEKRTIYRLLVGRPERKRQLGIQRHRWVDNIIMDLVGLGWGGVDWIGLAQDGDNWRALVNLVMNLRVP
jgi:hypothetical protein